MLNQSCTLIISIPYFPYSVASKEVTAFAHTREEDIAQAYEYKVVGIMESS